MSAPTPEQIAQRLREVRERIAAACSRAGRDAAEVGVVAVTKTFPARVVADAVAAGLGAIGENRAQELLEKVDAVAGLGGPAPAEWHFVGQVQRNKVKRLAPVVGVWHSVDRLKVGEAVARHAPGARVHVQVNVAGEEQKGGCGPSDTLRLVEGLRELGLEVVGLMTVPPLGDDPRRHFSDLRDLATSAGVPGLSMGMSGDYEVAVEEGATVVRLGSALFGPRPAPLPG